MNPQMDGKTFFVQTQRDTWPTLHADKYVWSWASERAGWR